MGHCSYRSLRFERRSEARHAGLPVGTVNYPNEFEFTRISDQRHLSGELDAAPLLITHTWPIRSRRQRALLSNTDRGDRRLVARYQTDATELDGKVFFAGRLGDYSYYNMDQACAHALALFEKRIVPLVTRAADAVPVPA